MPKSINTPSHTQTNVPASFKAGDAVLCPSLGNSAFKLIINPNDKHKRLAIKLEGGYFYYDKKGYFVSANERETDDFQPSIFHDTPANRQAIATLYSGSQSSQRKVIDTTAPDDDEVILMSAFELSDIACDIESAAIVISDIGKLLALIHYEKINSDTAISMARLTHDTTVAWDDLLQRQVSSIKETLAMTRYGKVGE